MTTEQPPPFREAPTAELLAPPAPPRPTPASSPPPPLPPPPFDQDPGEPVLPASPPTYDPSPFGSSGRVLPPLPAYSRPVPSPTRDRRHVLALVALCSAVVAALVTGLLFVTFERDGGDEAATMPSSRLQGSSGLDIQALLAKAQPSVVTIHTDDAERSSNTGAGTGVIISANGEILTNAHVVARAQTVRVTMHDGTEHLADVIGSFPAADVAMVRVQGASDLVAAQLGNSADARVGDEVVAIGNALNLGATPSVTRGIISALDRIIEAETVTLHGLIQTDAAINPGNSGGPLLNASGDVIGINTAIAAEAQNIGFAIPIDDVKPLLEQLRDGQGAVTPDSAFLGVGSAAVQDLSADDRDQLGITASRGAVISEVTPGSAAEDAGLQKGDVVVEIEGIPITSPEDLQNAIGAHDAGDEVTIEYERNGRKREVTVELGRRGG